MQRDPYFIARSRCYQCRSTGAEWWCGTTCGYMICSPCHRRRRKAQEVCVHAPTQQEVEVIIAE